MALQVLLLEWQRRVVVAFTEVSCKHFIEHSSYCGVLCAVWMHISDQCNLWRPASPRTHNCDICQIVLKQAQVTPVNPPNSFAVQLVYEFSWQQTSGPQRAANGAQGSTDAEEPSTALSAASMADKHLPAQTGHALQSDPQSKAHPPPDSLLLSPPQMAEFYPIAALPRNEYRAVSALQSGQVIAIPTDTLYGLAAGANSSAGIQQIYSIKHRQAIAPLAICIADIADLSRYCAAEHLSEQLLQQLLPGPVTLILRRKQDAPLSTELNPGLDTIGESITTTFSTSSCRCNTMCITVFRQCPALALPCGRYHTRMLKPVSPANCVVT